MKQLKQLNWVRGLGILGVIWFVGTIGDRLWFTLDHSVPAWDQADYLNGAVIYTQALQNPQWLSGEWWRSFWLLSSKIPPLTYILTVPFFNIFGISADSGTLVMLVFSAVLLVSVYGLGVILFNVSVGLWAALLCLLMPGLYYYRLEFLLDYPLSAIVTFSFCLLTLWYFAPEKTLSIKSWLKAIAFGISLGLGLMIKQTTLFFLLVPIVWAGGNTLISRQWKRFAQFIVGLGVSILVFGPWYRTNWLLMLTAGKRATVDSALIEGDPSLSSLAAWTYYFKILPYFLSWPLLLIPIVGFLMSWIYWRGKHNDDISSPLSEDVDTGEVNSIKGETPSKWLWLAVFLIGGYLLSSLNINKDARYILPLFPVFSLFLAVGLLSWQGIWKNYIRWLSVGLCFLLMLFNLFPLGGSAIANIFSPKMQHHPYLGKVWPHEEVIETILDNSPHLRTTLGVLPSTPEINQHTFSFYGGKFKQQVAGRQVGVRTKDIEKDAGSLDWFLTKMGDQGSVPDAQEVMVKRVENGQDFTLNKSWQLPDNSQLNLYSKKQKSVDIKPIKEDLKQVELEKIVIPEKVPPGEPVPIIYQWIGPWQQLENGIVILTWRSVYINKAKEANYQWVHDHGIGMGELFSGGLQKGELNQSFRVIERTAMLPDKNTGPGEYTLMAIYLNRKTGETYPIKMPPVTINIEPNVQATPAPQLDLVTQLREATKGLAVGVKGLEPIFDLTGRINQYDSTQDYVRQTDKSLSYRFMEDKNINWAYGMTIARVLQQDVKGALEALQEVIKLEPNNPYHYAYLAFVYLYDWQPYPAQEALSTALELNPDIPELRTLSGVAALMQGNLVKAWNELM